jgi:hypothetical protein
MELSSLEGFGSGPDTLIRVSRVGTLSRSCFEHRKIICLAWADSVRVSVGPARHPPYQPPAPGGAVLGLVACAVPNFSQRYWL